MKPTALGIYVVIIPDWHNGNRYHVAHLSPSGKYRGGCYAQSLSEARRLRAEYRRNHKKLRELYDKRKRGLKKVK